MSSTTTSTAESPSDALACEWTVSGMDCGSCAAKVRGAVERLPGVSGVEVLPMRERLRLTLDPAATSRERVKAVVRGLGYGVADAEASLRPAAPPESAEAGDDHGRLGHVRDDPDDRDKAWFRTG